MPSDHPKDFRLGPWKIEPLRGATTDPDGNSHHLEPKVMDVLVCLAEHANELVTRDDILEAVWGQHAVSDEPLTRAIGELRRAFQNDRGDSISIETVPKRGYRLIGEVVRAENSAEQLMTVGSMLVRRPITTLFAVGLVAIIAVYFVFDKVATTGDTTSTFEAESSIAVLPFVAMSSDDDDGYFSDGITEEILNALTRIKGLQVTSRTSSFSFKGKDVAIAEIAEALDVDHILEGSVRKSGTRVRIAAQLIEVSSDRHLWSEIYERELSDIFLIQTRYPNRLPQHCAWKCLGDDEKFDPSANCQSRST